LRESACDQETVKNFLSSLAAEQVRETRDLAERARQSAVSGTATPSRMSIRRLIDPVKQQKSNEAASSQD
jgi:hypothetical protein